MTPAIRRHHDRERPVKALTDITVLAEEKGQTNRAEWNCNGKSTVTPADIDNVIAGTAFTSTAVPGSGAVKAELAEPSVIVPKMQIASSRLDIVTPTMGSSDFGPEFSDHINADCNEG
jgi:hypothetical protein